MVKLIVQNEPQGCCQAYKYYSLRGRYSRGSSPWGNGKVTKAGSSAGSAENSVSFAGYQCLGAGTENRREARRAIKEFLERGFPLSLNT